MVAATGAWTRSFVEPAGVTVAVAPQRGQIVHLSAEPADTSRWPVVLPAGSGHYLLAFDGSRVVAGATGLTMGPYAGAVAARAALGEPPGFDLGPFNPLRAFP